MNSEMTTIEINGVKMEVDLRHARRVDTVKVGSLVKVLVKTTYGDDKVRPGVVVGFEPFDTLPTIIVCYVDITYDSARLEFAYINAKTSDKYEMVVSVDDEISFTKEDVISRINRERESLREKLEELDRKERFFLDNFQRYFAPSTAS